MAVSLAEDQKNRQKCKPLRKCVDNLGFAAMIALISLNAGAIHVENKIVCGLGR